MQKTEEEPAPEEEAKETQPKQKEEEKTFTEEELENIRNRLRALKQPIKIFGETNTDTFNRLVKLEQDDIADTTKGQEHNIYNQKELTVNLTEFQQELKKKLETKKLIDLEIGNQKVEDVIEIRHTKHSVYPDYKKFEKECKNKERKEKCTTILKWIK